MLIHKLLEEIDRPALKALPESPYVFAEWRICRVSIDYRVEVEAHYYSVPHRFVRAEVEVRFTARPFSIVPNLPGYAIPQHSDHGYGPLARFDDTTLDPGGGFIRNATTIASSSALTRASLSLTNSALSLVSRLVPLTSMWPR